MPNLSRRSLVTSAAALPALAVPAVAASSAHADDDKLVALADKVAIEWDRLGEICIALDAAEEKLWAWEKLNPNAVEAEKLAFAKECGHEHADAFQQSVSDEMWSTLDVMRVTPARSIRGLIAKARTAHKLLRDADGKSHSEAPRFNSWDIVNDLLAMEVQS